MSPELGIDHENGGRIVGIRIFSLEEANSLLPELSKQLEGLRDLVARIVRDQDGIAVLDLIGARENGSPEHIEYMTRKRATESLVAELDARIREIQAYGCFVKDINQGLVDFYSVRGGRLIFLCWKLGETGIAHWHELNTGFTGRQPIAELDE
ncbi:MAG: DUF2203 domain-containing protein [bacterium]